MVYDQMMAFNHTFTTEAWYINTWLGAQYIYDLYTSFDATYVIRERVVIYHSSRLGVNLEMLSSWLLSHHPSFILTDHYLYAATLSKSRLQAGQGES